MNRVLKELRHATEEAWIILQTDESDGFPIIDTQYSACRGKAGMILFFMFLFRSN